MLGVMMHTTSFFDFVFAVVVAGFVDHPFSNAVRHPAVGDFWRDECAPRRAAALKYDCSTRGGAG